MNRPLAGALFAAGALSLSVLGAAGAAQAETVQPGNVTSTTTGNQITVTCPHPDDPTLQSVVQLNFASLAAVNGSFTEAADLLTADAFATDASSGMASLVNSADHVDSVELKLYSNDRDAVTGPAVIYDGLLFNSTNKMPSFHFRVNKKHISYGTMTVKWSKAGGAADSEVLTCSYPNHGLAFSTGTGPNYG